MLTGFKLKAGHWCSSTLCDAKLLSVNYELRRVHCVINNEMDPTYLEV